jgi:hypothetical protein
MRKLLDPLPPLSFASDTVPLTLYRRHLGLPESVTLDERFTELADQARDWYLEHGSPWNDACPIRIQSIAKDTVFLEEGLALRSALLAEGLARADARAIVVFAATAGAAVDRRIDELWKMERPDEAMFLNAYAIAVVERLRLQARDHLRQIYGTLGMAVLPHYSPGYEGWDLVDQAQLFQVVFGRTTHSKLPLRVLASGGLWPAKSTIAAYGVTERSDMDACLDGYWMRRPIVSASNVQTPSEYAFPAKALTLWRSKRLQLAVQPNQEIRARFRFEGSTCSNLGVPITIDYHIYLERNGGDGYRVTHSSCKPADGDVGVRSTCAYLDNPALHMAEMDSYQPLIGMRLDDALAWNPPISQSGCLCSQAAQNHKWRIVLQTIHFALVNHE